MNQIRRKVFVGPTLYWGFRCLNFYRDRIRDEAEAFINREIGLERLISVNEHVTGNGPFSVVIWYRAAEGSTPSQTLEMSNQMLKEPVTPVEQRPAPSVGNQSSGKGRWS
jgi:hypothetical protein